MSWATIDQERCTGCGLCAAVCLRCITQEGKKMTITAGEENCNLCGHCVAICPSDAVVHHKMDMAAFKKIEGGALAAEDLMAFLRSRRSHRNFLEKEIPAGIMKTLFEICRYAPTGSNVQSVEVLALKDRGKINRLIDLTVEYFQRLIPRTEEKVQRLKAKGQEIPAELQWALRRNYNYSFLKKSRELGRDPIFRGAPLVLVFHSVPYTSSPKDNAVIAAHTIALTAMTLGLESCYIGLFEGAARNDTAVKAELELPPGHEVFSVLVLGYPRYKFLRTVDRKPIQVQWV